MIKFNKEDIQGGRLFELPVFVEGPKYSSGDEIAEAHFLQVVLKEDLFSVKIRSTGVSHEGINGMYVEVEPPEVVELQSEDGGQQFKLPLFDTGYIVFQLSTDEQGNPHFKTVAQSEEVREVEGGNRGRGFREYRYEDIEHKLVH